MNRASVPRERILVLTSSYPRVPGDAAGHFVESEVRALRNAGHQLTVWAAGDGTRDQSDVEFLGGRSLFDYPGALERLRRNPLRAIQVARILGQIRSRAAELAFDRVIAHWLVPGAVPWALALPDHLPLEVVCHGSDVRLFQKLPQQARLYFLRRLKARKAELRFVSAELKEALSDHLPQDLWSFAARARVAPSPIDCGPNISQRQARRCLGLPPEVSIGVIVSRLIDDKRVDVALRAAALVPGLRSTVIGSGPLEAQLKGEFPNAHFIGQRSREETLCWMRAADVLLTASRKEGAPTVVREARAVGTPVVTVPSGDTRMWARTDREIWLVD